ncbi:hypothetical protein I6E11_09650 [Bacteroides caecigallinarum]|nr:hypothetical protein [Bacteroides caecigallinarum]
MNKAFVIIVLIANLAGLYAYDQQELSKYSWKVVANGMPEEWYATDQAVEVAKNVICHQTDIGGWTKNTAFHKSINEQEWEKVCKTGVGATFDNGATITEMRFLAKMYKYRKD